MTVRTRLRRCLLVAAAAAVALTIGMSPAWAHHCFVPMYSLTGPTASENWFVMSAEQGAEFEAGYVTECAEAAEAGYAALRAQGLPVGIKIFAKMTIGDPRETGRMNPNGANNKGLEYFGAGSGLPMTMVATYIQGASSVSCEGD